MKHTLQNDRLRISVLTKGAELCEIKSVDSGLDYLWNGDPAVWSSFAPVLFPAIGAVKGGEVFFEGQSYALPRHGFVRNNDKMILTEKSDSSLTFFLGHDEDTLSVFPFNFEFYIHYRLLKNRLTISHSIVNNGPNSMYFSLGGHPAIKCPILDHEVYSDYYLQFDHVENEVTWLLDAQGLVSTETKPVLENTSILSLSHALFNSDALIFKHLKSKGVTLKSHTGTHSVRVDYDDFPYLGIWSKPHGNFVCIEPWLGIADSTTADQELTHKEGIVELPATTTYEASYSITVLEDH